MLPSEVAPLIAIGLGLVCLQLKCAQGAAVNDVPAPYLTEWWWGINSVMPLKF